MQALKGFYTLCELIFKSRFTFTKIGNIALGIGIKPYNRLIKTAQAQLKDLEPALIIQAWDMTWTEAISLLDFLSVHHL